MNDIASEIAPDPFAPFTEANTIGSDVDRLKAEAQLPAPGEPPDLEALPNLYGAELLCEGVVQ